MIFCSVKSGGKQCPEPAVAYVIIHSIRYLSEHARCAKHLGGYETRPLPHVPHNVDLQDEGLET